MYRLRKEAIGKILFLIFLLSSGIVFAQISPPGLGVANTASWCALGIRQYLDTTKRWQSVSYVGLGRKSSPDNFSPVSKNGILVFNQEFYHQFHKNYQYSLAVSYRRQDEYSDVSPYDYKANRIKQEFRIYSRFAYSYKISRFKISPIIRQEFRKFYASDFSNLAENFQLRTRMRIQLTMNLDRQNLGKLILNAESLFAVSKENNPGKWTGFHYSESRFSFYYSVSLQKIPLTLSIGYMNNLIGMKSPRSVHYFAFDIILENLF
jgi:hypothetical protein